MINEIEKRFIEVFSSIHPTKQDVATYGECYTPEYIDEMLNLTTITPETKILDLCCGIGNFTIRILRRLSDTYPHFDVNAFLTHYHTFNEIRPERIEQIRYIYGETARIITEPAQSIKNLYEYFDIDMRTQEYITNYLPDYYNIRCKSNE